MFCGNSVLTRVTTKRDWKPVQSRVHTYQIEYKPLFGSLLVSCIWYLVTCFHMWPRKMSVIIFEGRNKNAICFVIPWNKTSLRPSLIHQFVQYLNKPQNKFLQYLLMNSTSNYGQFSNIFQIVICGQIIRRNLLQ